jgi:hypothetical protein
VDINEYISSGVLELYVAGALSPGENREVEEIARQHREVRSEIDAIQAAFESIAGAPGVNPRPELRAVILDTIDELEGAHDVAPVDTVAPTNDAAPAAAGTAAPSRATVIPIPSRTRYLLAASITIAILSSGAAAYFAYQWRSTEGELAAINSG